MEIRKAQRSRVKIRVGFSGPAGSGKTYSALLLAKGLASLEKTVVIDTEADRASFYDHLGGYSVLNIVAPFTPEKFCDAIEKCAKSGFEVIIVDSISAFWSGEGGFLEQVDKAAQGMKGNSFQAWGKITPGLQKVSAMIQFSNCHVIINFRSKVEYAMENVNGKNSVKKLGLKPDYKEGMDYEMTTFFEINNTVCEVSKDCTGVFNLPFTVTEATGKALIDWSNSGKPYIPTKPVVTLEDEYFHEIADEFLRLLEIPVNAKAKAWFNDVANWPISKNNLEKAFNKCKAAAGNE